MVQMSWGRLSGKGADVRSPRRAERLDKKLIIEVYYRYASGRTPGSACESSRELGESEEEGKGMREQSAATNMETAQKADACRCSANNSETAVRANELGLI